jgi:hypothetical protein
MCSSVTHDIYIHDILIVMFLILHLLAPVPTQPPVAPTPITPSPTSQSSIAIRATPYSLSYLTVDKRLPTASEYAEVTELTRMYLEEFMLDEFAQTTLTNLDDFLTVMVQNTYILDEPVLIEYRSTGLFNPSSIFLPTTRELNMLILEAFQDENLLVYIERLNALPSSNIFSSTIVVVLGAPIAGAGTQASTQAAGGSRTSFATKTSIIAGAAGIFVLAAGVFLLRRRSVADDDNEFDKVIRRKGSEDMDMTIAGETCNMSVDASADWRQGHHKDREEELQEYDLDGDSYADSVSAANR